MDDVREFLSAVSADLEGNTSDEVGSICILCARYRYMLRVKLFSG